MRFGQRKGALATGLMLASVIFALGGCAQAQNQASQGPAAAISGAVGAQLEAPEGFSVTVDKVERDASQWLFHIHAQSSAAHSIQVIGSGADHQFVLVEAKPAGTPASEGIVVLTAPAQADLATHPAFPASLAAKASSEGWLRADLTTLKYPPQLLLYHYASVSATRCDNPSDQSTCRPVTLFSDLEWDLQA